MVNDINLVKTVIKISVSKLQRFVTLRACLFPRHLRLQSKISIF
jgi:hypothetical protein